MKFYLSHTLLFASVILGDQQSQNCAKQRCKVFKSHWKGLLHSKKNSYSWSCNYDNWAHFSDNHWLITLIVQVICRNYVWIHGSNWYIDASIFKYWITLIDEEIDYHEDATVSSYGVKFHPKKLLVEFLPTLWLEMSIYINYGVKIRSVEMSVRSFFYRIKKNSWALTKTTF